MGEDEYGDLKPAFIAEVCIYISELNVLHGFSYCFMCRLKQKKFSFLLQSFPNLKTLVWEKKVYLIITEFSPPADKKVFCMLLSCKTIIFLRWLRYHDKCILLRLCCKMISFINFTFYIDIYVEKEEKEENLTRSKDIKGG
ncbi:hypothetical protein Bca4012_071747 [Brassica carinata]